MAVHESNHRGREQVPLLATQPQGALRCELAFACAQTPAWPLPAAHPVGHKRSSLRPGRGGQARDPTAAAATPAAAACARAAVVTLGIQPSAALHAPTFALVPGATWCWTMMIPRWPTASRCRACAAPCTAATAPCPRPCTAPRWCAAPRARLPACCLLRLGCRGAARGDADAADAVETWPNRPRRPLLPLALLPGSCRMPRRAVRRWGG